MKSEDSCLSLSSVDGMLDLSSLGTISCRVHPLSSWLFGVAGKIKEGLDCTGYLNIGPPPLLLEYISTVPSTDLPASSLLDILVVPKKRHEIGEIILCMLLFQEGSI